MFYVPQRASGPLPPVQGFTKKSPPVYELSLRSSFASPPGNQGQANRLPSHCQINRLLMGVLSFKSSNSVGSHALWNLGHKGRDKNSAISIAVISNYLVSFRIPHRKSLKLHNDQLF